MKQMLHCIDDQESYLLRLKRDAIGLDVEYPTVSNGRTRRIYLDSAATSLRLKVVQVALDNYQSHYANVHSNLHFAARISTREYQWAHDMVLEFVDADPRSWMCFFVGNGTTGGMNRVARLLRAHRPERDVVITTVMEHHSNDLPHRKHFREVVHVPTDVTLGSFGGVDIKKMEAALQEHKGKVNYVAVTGVSNVTGIINPVHEIAELAHRYGALVVLDAAQMAAHIPIKVSGHAEAGRDLDVIVFSGHKLYAPGSPGVVVARKDLFASMEPDEVGGGMVNKVWLDRYTVAERFPDREEAGTPNIPGAIGLATALYALNKVGMDRIAADEHQLFEYALRNLADVSGIVIYGGTTSIEHRTGVISFNLAGYEHAFCAAVLNDYFNIAVRNECFCAHPYVRDLVMRSLEGVTDSVLKEEQKCQAEENLGMVRASFGLYNTKADVDHLVAALNVISIKGADFLALYDRLANGDYRHRQFAFDSTKEFSVRSTVDLLLGDAQSN